jgi:hypothetical protein
MTEPERDSPRFAICVEIGAYEVSLERWKVYPLVPDATAEADGLFRVIDESGEAYLYPKEYFRLVELPAAIAKLYAAAHPASS